MAKLRLLVAVWLGKIAIRLLRLTSHSGTTLPGRVSLKVAPFLLERLGQTAAGARVVITGTNGKTTTAAFLGNMLKEANRRFVRNVSGANLPSGIATTMVEHASLGGTLSTEFLLTEVDEAMMPRVTRALQPEVTVVTNFFRDQLDRYGELDRIVGIVGGALRFTSHTVCLNADDPMVAGLVKDLPPGVVPIMFGIEGGEVVDQADRQGTMGARVGVDTQFCPICGTRFEYETVTYGHLGIYRCPGCSFTRPTLDVGGRILSEGGDEMAQLEIRHVATGGTVTVALKIPGLYNAYNALAAATAGLALGLTLSEVARGIEAFTGAFGRMERVALPSGEMTLALVKNPVGFNEVLRTVQNVTAPRVLMIAINDRLADGTDISWLWDVDFERLREVSGIHFVVSGRRAKDMAVRLKYAGVSTDRLEVITDLQKAVSRSLELAGDQAQLFVLPTYTAMLALRAELVRRGLVSAMWKG